MTKPTVVAIRTAMITGVIVFFPSYVLAQEFVQPSGGEVLARWLALSMTAFGMVGSGGVAYGVTKTMMGNMKEKLMEQGETLDKIFGALAERPTIDRWKELRDLEKQVHVAELSAIRESIEGVRKDLGEVKRLLGDRRE